ncbi:hypothetical protein LIA77_08139 [Sarocladium implicatum]|nr:hypothetical protein LIA77_08139 [Sarocladium implicatum]
MVPFLDNADAVYASRPKGDLEAVYGTHKEIYPRCLIRIELSDVKIEPLRERSAPITRFCCRPWWSISHDASAPRPYSEDTSACQPIPQVGSLSSHDPASFSCFPNIRQHFYGAAILTPSPK